MIESSTHVRVRYADTDQMGVVYHTKYLEWFEVGRTELLRDLGIPYSRMEEEGIGLPVIEAHCLYKRGAVYDQLLLIISRLKELPRATVRIDYEIFNEDRDLLVSGYTVHIFLGKIGRPIKPPKSFMQVITHHFGKDNGKGGEIAPCRHRCAFSLIPFCQRLGYEVAWCRPLRGRSLSPGMLTGNVLYIYLLGE